MKAAIPALFFAFAAALLACTTAAIAGEVRTWTSSDGRTLDAEFISRTASTVTLKRTVDGAQFTLPLARLSADDQAWASAQPESRGDPLNKLSLILDIQLEQRDRRSTDWQTDWGSYEKSGAFLRALVISAKTIQDGADPVVDFRYAFVGHDQGGAGGGATVVYDSGTVRGKVGRGTGIKTLAFSSVHTTQDNNYAAIGEHDVSGVIPIGWVVVVMQGGNEVLWQGSDPGMVNWLKGEIQAGRFEFRPMKGGDKAQPDSLGEDITGS